MDDLTCRLLKLFNEMGSESLDLHTLFEAGGNDPESRKRVLDVVTGLVDTGFLESRGSDFYFTHRRLEDGQRDRDMPMTAAARDAFRRQIKDTPGSEYCSQVPNRPAPSRTSPMYEKDGRPR